MRLALKIVLGILIAFLLVVAGAFVYAMLMWDRTFDVGYPEIEASSEASVIERGRYLVYGAAACVDCHGEVDRLDEVKSGVQIPLSGGRVFDTPLGKFHVPNITSHQNGVGDDGARTIARAIRRGVRHDDRAMMPFMEYHMLSDEDLTAVVSYLLASKPVARRVSEHELTVLGKALFAFVIEPAEVESEPSERTPESTSPEYGEYLAHHVSLCVSCHTARDLKTHEKEGPAFAGGGLLPHTSNPDKRVSSPNLTPDPETGIMVGWSEQEFVARFRKAEPSTEGSAMPWASYRAMSDEDLVAIYRYLIGLEPIHNDTLPLVRAAE